MDPADVPLTSKVATSSAAHVTPSTSQAPARSQKKRKATFEQAAPTNSQLSSVKPVIRATCSPIVYDVDEDDDEDEVILIESDPVDVLYCTLSSSIVGVQYYKGDFFCRFSSHMHLFMWCSKVSLVLGRKSR